MKAHNASTDELAEATERTLTGKTFMVDGVPAEVLDVGTTADGEIDIRTNAGMFTKAEWHSKVCDGEIAEI